MKQMYYEFSEGGGLTVGVLDRKNNEFYISTEHGGYLLDGAKIGLHTGSIQTCIYEIDDNTLLLRPFSNGVIDNRDYLKLKKIK